MPAASNPIDSPISYIIAYAVPRIYAKNITYSRAKIYA